MAHSEDILAIIDAALGTDEETEDEHEARRLMIERDHRARQIRRDHGE